VARVVVAEAARRDLAALIRSHGLPASTKDRVRRSIEPLAKYPLLGPALTDRWADYRVILGPWTWMLIVYAFDEPGDLVIVVTTQDARSGSSPRAIR
jgi:hypothetical protein